MASTIKPQGFNRRAGFTLIELLVVIAIVAVLSVIVILTLNPAELLRQARDSTRLSDMASISRAISIFQVDQGGPLGTASTTYVSIADTSATCANLGLPSLPAGYTYNCVTTSTLRNTDGTGWIPVNFKNMSTGAPLSALPIDPNNTTSSRLYYTYTANSGVFEVTAAMESSKYKVGGGADVVSTDGGQYPDLLEKGTSLTLEPLDYGDSSLVGYWAFNEGSGTVANDTSGNGNTGTVGAGATWVAGEVGAGALRFNGVSSNSYVNVGSSSNLNPANFTISAWVNPADVSGSYNYIYSNARDCCGTYNGIEFVIGGNLLRTTIWNGTFAYVFAGTSIANNSGWQLLTTTYDGNTVNIYINGTISNSNGVALGVGTPASSGNTIGAMGFSPSAPEMNGIIDDVRIYNRALSAAEIAAIYSARN